MKVLVVCSAHQGRVAPFIEEQMAAVAHQGYEVAWFLIQHKGVLGYLQELPRFYKTVRREQPDVVHAHYGLSGLLANLQRRVPVVTTYHGSDINVPRVLPLSKLAIRLSAYNIFVSKAIWEKGGRPKQSVVLPCGVNLDLFHPMAQDEARKLVDWGKDDKIVLFAGAFDNAVKNAALAQESMALLPGVTLKELKGYRREEVVYALNGADCLLMTSFSEGSPQVVKEALACGCPVVSVDVGDVKEILRDNAFSYIVERDPIKIASAVENVLTLKINKSLNPLLFSYDNSYIVSILTNIYQQLVISKYNIDD